MIFVFFWIFILIKKFSVFFSTSFTSAYSTSLRRKFNSSLRSWDDTYTSLVVVLMRSFTLGTTKVMWDSIIGLWLFGFLGFLILFYFFLSYWLVITWRATVLHVVLRYDRLTNRTSWVFYFVLVKLFLFHLDFGLVLFLVCHL